MLKIVENGQEAIEVVTHLAEQSFMKDFQVGLTGSFANNENKKASSIDIALKLRPNGNKELLGCMALTKQILNFLGGHFHHKFNIMWLDLLSKDEEDIISFIKEEGVEANPESVYSNIVAALQWVNNDDLDSDDLEFEEELEEELEEEEEGDEIDG